MNISKDGEDYRTVENLVQELYDASCEAKNWAMVRHTSGRFLDYVFSIL